MSEESILRDFIAENNIGQLDIISHRVVHGGEKFVSACIIDQRVEQEINQLSSLAPLHNPIALKWIRHCRRIFNIPQIAVFDTAFFSALPPKASTYALPADLSRRHGIRRYGFHGLAHCAMSQRWQELHPNLAHEAKVITLQLGSGCSIAAIKGMIAVDTSMGFSPLEGLIMSTRSGDIDPGIIIYLQRSPGFPIDRIEDILNYSSGLKGLSETSENMKVLLETDTPQARFAIESYCYRARKYIGSYLAVLENADAIIFGGGVGENAPLVRELILKGMVWCGIELDLETNSTTMGQECCISSSASKVEVWVIPVDEATILAEEAQKQWETIGKLLGGVTHE